MHIPFSRPYKSTGEISNLLEVFQSGHSHGDGPFTLSASKRVEEISGATKALLTTSGTHALEMASHLIGLKEGDEVIVPSFTFSSGATAIVAAGATPVFVDIEGKTGNISVPAVQQAITAKTRAISVMHYGGQPASMGEILRIADEYGLAVIEDNAHGLGVETGNGVLGSLGMIGIQSFHATKNVQCGEGGALLISDKSLIERAEIMREKGTNRSKFFRGQVDKYTWVDWGSSYLPSEYNAAVLESQLGEFELIQEKRHYAWNTYKSRLSDWALDRGVELMSPPDGIHAAHVFFMLMRTPEERGTILDSLRNQGITATFHYVPLHSSPAGEKYGKVTGDMSTTNSFSSRLVRLPLFSDITEVEIDYVVEKVRQFTS